MRFLKFFTANIRNPHTRRAYGRAAEEFLTWCASVGVSSIAAVQPMHVATWIKAFDARARRAKCKATAGGDPHPFDCLVTGQVVPVNPAHAVRGPRYVVHAERTAVTPEMAVRLGELCGNGPNSGYPCKPATTLNDCAARRRPKSIPSHPSGRPDRTRP